MPALTVRYLSAKCLKDCLEEAGMQQAPQVQLQNNNGSLPKANHKYHANYGVHQNHLCCKFGFNV